MADDRLATKFIVMVGGREYHSAPDTGAPGQPVSLEIEHRDNESSRASVKVWELVDMDHIFTEFNALPNPRCNENIPYSVFGGWEDGSMVKMFAGVLFAKKASYQLSQTELVGLHKAFKLKKRAKPRTFVGLTVAEMLKKLAAEEGVNLIIDKSAAGDEALHEPTSWMVQLGEPNWKMMLRYIHSLGYVTNTIRDGDMILKANKLGSAPILVERGNLELKTFDIREEQKRSKRSPRVKGHGHEAKPGKFIHTLRGVDCGDGKAVRLLPAAIAKKRKQERAPFVHHTVRQTSRRLETEGDEITMTFRLKPEMRNEEVIELKGFGGQIDGLWETAAVTHRFGRSTATTDVACWRKAD